MLSRNSRCLWMILLALTVAVSVQAQQATPLETIKIDTNLS